MSFFADAKNDIQASIGDSAPQELGATPLQEEADIPKEEGFAEKATARAVPGMTVIAADTVLTGSLSTKGSAEVYGTVEGDVECGKKLKVAGKITGKITASEMFVEAKRLESDISCDGCVKIGRGTVVIGDVHATSFVLAGAVKGDIDVPGPVVLDATAVVKGGIKAESVQMMTGAVLSGTCDLCYGNNDIDALFGEEE